MKKILLSVVCLVVVGIQSVQAQVAIAALHHNNAVTIYAATQIQAAIDTAEPGDTIYLSEGIFGGFTVAKPIAIIGAGQTTWISSDITIGKENVSLEAGLFLGGVNFIQDVNFKYVVDGVRISQCKFEQNCNFVIGNTNSYSNIEIMMSHIVGELDFSSGATNNSYVKSITVVNSKIELVRSGPTGEGGSTFLNCNVRQAHVGSTVQAQRNSYVNCIVNAANSGVFKNCLYETYNSTGATLVDCYTPNTGFSLTDNLDSPLSDDELRQAGYLGTDGTVVGITGGDVPFTLVSAGLQVVEHNFEVDNINKQMKVTLKLGNK